MAGEKKVKQIPLGPNESLDAVYDPHERHYLLVVAERKRRVQKRTLVILNEDEARELGHFLLGSHNRLRVVTAAEVDDGEED